MQKMQNSRARVRAAINHQNLDRIPRGELCIDDDLIEQCLNVSQVGFDERVVFVEELGLDLVTLAPVYPNGDTIPATLDDQLLLPDLESWATKTPYFTFALLDGAFGWGTRIMDYVDFLMLPNKSPLSFQALFEKVEQINKELILRLIDRGVDGVIIADDIAYTKGLIISPEVLRKFLFPSLKRQIAAAKGRIPFFFHSDGNYSGVIPDLVDCGFRGLQCFERQAGMDPLELKRSYPEVTVWGTLEVDDLMKANEPEHLEKLVTEIHTLYSQQGFILGTTCGLFKGIDLEGLKTIYRQVANDPLSR